MQINQQDRILSYAFTLTEVLLAVVIVGVIAAIVLPAAITHFQERGFTQAYDREIKIIESAINGLAVNENKSSFFDTMMYVNTEPETYTESAEKFLKKYLRISKICGDNNGDCFGKKYYEYKDNDKKVYSPEFKGSCASLKNGMSICITPQVGVNAISGFIDLNGPKGPNIFNKDLRTFSIETQTRTGFNKQTAEVLDTAFDPIQEGVEDPCSGKSCGCGSLPDCTTPPPPQPPCPPDKSTWDLSCCLTHSSLLTSTDSHCCSMTEVYNSVTACHPQYFQAKLQYIKGQMDANNPRNAAKITVTNLGGKIAQSWEIGCNISCSSYLVTNNGKWRVEPKMPLTYVKYGEQLGPYCYLSGGNCQTIDCAGETSSTQLTGTCTIKNKYVPNISCVLPIPDGINKKESNCQVAVPQN